MSNEDPQIVARKLEALKRAIEIEVGSRLPRKVGVIAVQHFRQNFREGGFRDGGLRPWQKSKRELAGGKSAQARYKTLTSARNHLMSSTQSITGRGEVSIENAVPYAVVHNEGGTLTSSPTITPKMRRYAWAMVYRLSGRKRGKKQPLSPEAQKWKALALTKKTTLHIKAKIPKRQFIGESQELTQKINKEINDSIKKIQHGISTL